MKNTTFTTIIARIALPVVIGGAALGMAGVASAQTEPFGSGYQYAPHTIAEPAHGAPSSHHGVARVEELVPGYQR